MRWDVKIKGFTNCYIWFTLVKVTDLVLQHFLHFTQVIDLFLNRHSRWRCRLKAVWLQIKKLQVQIPPVFLYGWKCFLKWNHDTLGLLSARSTNTKAGKWRLWWPQLCCLLRLHTTLFHQLGGVAHVMRHWSSSFFDVSVLTLQFFRKKQGITSNHL